MNRMLSITSIAAALFVTASFSANAAPLSPQSQNATSAVEKAHSYHRSCSRGHRHQRDGDRMSCGYYYRDTSPGITLQFGTRDRGYRHRDRHHRRDRRDRR